MLSSEIKVVDKDTGGIKVMNIRFILLFLGSFLRFKVTRNKWVDVWKVELIFETKPNKVFYDSSCSKIGN